MIFCTPEHIIASPEKKIIQLLHILRLEYDQSKKNYQFDLPSAHSLTYAPAAHYLASNLHN